jgi:hypothetical protein
MFRGLSDAASFFSPQFATIGHTPPDCGEEVASSNHGLLVRASAAYIPQRHGELCNPPVAASGSVDVLLRCGTPPEQYDTIKAQVGLSLPDFAVSDDAKHRKRHQPGAKSEQQPLAAGPAPVSCYGGKFIRTANSDLWLKTGVSKPIAIMRRIYAAAEDAATLSG